MIAGVLLAAVLGLAPLEAYNQGNQLYAQKDYAGAIQAYERALTLGPSAAVHYNLGNANFKAGHIGRAILNYRRARALAPGDPDVAANLTFARSYRVDKLPEPGGLGRTLDAAFHLLSRSTAVELASLGCLLASLLLGLWIVRRAAVLAIAAVLVAPVALYGFLTGLAWAGEIAEHPAVVVVPEVEALSGPGSEFKQILLVHDGTEVRIREARGDYLLVQLPGGTGGWVKKNTVERVYP